MHEASWQQTSKRQAPKSDRPNDRVTTVSPLARIYYEYLRVSQALTRPAP